LCFYDLIDKISKSDGIGKDFFKISSITFGSGRALRIYFFCNDYIFVRILFVKFQGIFFFNVRLMLSLKMITFRKSANCPSSEKLVAFQTTELPGGESDKITIHLRFCEFCAAEVEFYAHYPQAAEEKIEQADIPLPLYELAEALLKKRDRDASVLDRMLDKDEFDY
jgi:hypothetical protein